MKKIIFLSLLLATSIWAIAQNTDSIIYSAPFEEPHGLKTKIIQCSNGNTFLFNFTISDGIEITVFNDKHVQASKFVFKSSRWKPVELQKTVINGIYEINGDIVMFIELDDKVEKSEVFLFRKEKIASAKLFRVIFDGTTGRVKNEMKLADGAYPGEICVAKDPASDNYSVACFYFSSQNSGPHLDLQSFNGEHKEIAHSTIPEQNFYRIRPVAMTVVGDITYLCTYSTGNNTRLMLSKLKAGANILESKVWENELDMKYNDAVMLYNPAKNILELLVYTFVYVEEKYGGTVYTYLDLKRANIESLDLLSSTPVNTSVLQEYSKSRWGKYAGKFNGRPMDMILKPDNNIAIIFEEPFGVEYSLGKYVTNTNTYMKMGLLEFDGMGGVRDGYVVRKFQVSKSGKGVVFLNARHNNRIDFDVAADRPTNHPNSGFYSYDFINTANGSYFIFNDLPENFNNDSTDLERMIKVSESNTICYTLKNGEWDKKYLFGKPTNKRDNRFSYIYSGNYNSKTGKYAIMVIEHIGGKKKVRIAWVPFN